MNRSKIFLIVFKLKIKIFYLKVKKINNNNKMQKKKYNSLDNKNLFNTLFKINF